MHRVRAAGSGRRCGGCHLHGDRSANRQSLPLGRAQLRAARPAGSAGAYFRGEQGRIVAPRIDIPLADDPLWYKDAIFYELRVRSFYDSDGDGVGDFRGLTEKLDYLQHLGVTALWLLP